MNLKRRIIKLLHPLTTITLEPTNDCNMDCSYCPRKMRPVGYMDFNLFKRLVNEIPSKTHISLSFGGESILHRRFEEMAKLAHQKFGQVSVKTNETLKYPNFVHAEPGIKPPPVIFTYNQKFRDGVPNGWKPRYNYCIAPYYSMVILWNGDVTVCCHDVAGVRVLDNVMAKSVVDVWKGKAYRNLRRKGFCEGCELYKYYGK